MTVLSLCVAILLAACSEEVGGPITVKVIQPAPGHCNYRIDYAQVETLDSLREMRGRVGRVLYTDEDLKARPEILDLGEGLRPMDLQFAGGGGRYAPLDLRSLGAISLYRSVETVYLLMGRLDPAADLANLTPTLADTSIIYEAKMADEDGQPITDNAAYQPYYIQEAGDVVGIRNYIYSFPSNEISTLPLKFNHGIVGHEAAHFVNWYLWRQAASRNSPDATTKNTFGALDEGMADYVGFMVTGDPGFFLCTFPKENRDIAVPKTFTAGMGIHRGGAVWAAAQYQIGNIVGHEQNLRTLIQMFSNYASCPGTSTGVRMRDIANCHMRYVGATNQISTIYRNAFGN